MLVVVSSVARERWVGLWGEIEISLTRVYMPPNRMRVQIERVHLKVDPVKHEGLYKSQDSFAEESVNPHLNIALVQQTQHARSKD